MPALRHDVRNARQILNGQARAASWQRLGGLVSDKRI